MRINKIQKLEEIKSLCFTKDTRAVWVGVGMAQTDVDQYKNYASWANEHLTMYFGFLPLSSHTNCLDVGCGCGHSTINLKEYHEKVDGIDYDQDAINFAKNNNSADGINYYNEDFLFTTNLKKYDNIFALEILEHILSINHFDFVDKCISLLSPGGKLFITTPNEPYGIDAGHHRGILNKEKALEFYNRYSSNIEKMWYYDNTKLNIQYPSSSIIEGCFDDYLKQDGINRSHFSFVIKG